MCGEAQHLAFVAQGNEAHRLRDGFVVLAGGRAQAVGMAQARKATVRPDAGRMKDIEFANTVDREHRALVEARVAGGRHGVRRMVVVEAHRGVGPQSQSSEEFSAPEPRGDVAAAAGDPLQQVVDVHLALFALHPAPHADQPRLDFLGKRFAAEIPFRQEAVHQRDAIDVRAADTGNVERMRHRFHGQPAAIVLASRNAFLGNRGGEPALNEHAGGCIVRCGETEDDRHGRGAGKARILAARAVLG